MPLKFATVVHSSSEKNPAEARTPTCEELYGPYPKVCGKVIRELTRTQERYSTFDAAKDNRILTSCSSTTKRRDYYFRLFLFLFCRQPMRAEKVKLQAKTSLTIPRQSLIFLATIVMSARPMIGSLAMDAWSASPEGIHSTANRRSPFSRNTISSLRPRFTLFATTTAYPSFPGTTTRSLLAARWSPIPWNYPWIHSLLCHRENFQSQSPVAEIVEKNST